MSWSYSGDPSSSNKDAVRFLLGDTDAEQPLISDEEVEYILSLEANVIRAAAIGAESIAGKFSSKVDRSIGDFSESLSDLASQYLELARKLRKQAKQTSSFKAVPFAGGISKDVKKTLEKDTDRVKPSFSRGMMENERRF